MVVRKTFELYLVTCVVNSKDSNAMVTVSFGCGYEPYKDI